MPTSFCPNCFAGGFAGRCGACGYIAISQAGNAMLLPPGTVLNGRYLLGRTLGAGGFGITYLAKDQGTGALVAVKEYLPAMLAVRDAASSTVYPSSQDNRETFEHGLKVFNKESQVLRRFAGNDSIVQVMECFEENGTAYFAMEYLDGMNLKALARSMGDRLPVPTAMEVLHSVGATLQAVHAQGLLHRDVSPENIFVTKEGRVKLIDFGATRFFVGERSRSLSVILKPGFAPPEQYSSKGNQGPWTDIYALCATVYNLLAGRPLPDAPDRLAGVQAEPLAALAAGVPPALSAAVERGLALDYRQRPQSMEEFLAEARGSQSGRQTGPGAQSGMQGAAVAAPPQPQPQALQQVQISPAQLPPQPAPAQGQPARAPAPGQMQPPQGGIPAVLAGTPTLQMLAGTGAGDKWLLPKNMPMAIGRSSEQCNIVLDEPNVSRLHCTIIYNERDNLFILTDRSSNGTLIDSGRLEKDKAYTLRPGDVFYITTRACALKVGLE